jgi:hypothetical protein
MLTFYKMSREVELNIIEEEPSIIKVHTQEQEQSKVTEFANTIQSLTEMLLDGMDNYIIDENNLVEYIIRIMTIMEQQRNLTGLQKKAVAVEILLRLVDSYDRLSIESKQKTKLLVRTLAPSIIDSIIMASKGLIAINKKIEETTKKCCFCFFK